MDELQSSSHFAHRFTIAFGLIVIAAATLLAGTWNWERDAAKERVIGEMNISAPAALTTLSELPPRSGVNGRWDFIIGLNATPLGTAKDGEPVLRIAAEPGEYKHGLGVRYTGQLPDHDYRVRVRVKDVMGPNIMLEVRDSVDLKAGHAPNYAFVYFDAQTGSKLRSSGELVGEGSKADSAGWRSFWVDFHSKDGAIFAATYLLEAGSNLQLFQTKGQYLTWCGYEIDPIGAAPMALPTTRSMPTK